jgi:DNA topoisomerase VI subunit B
MTLFVREDWTLFRTLATLGQRAGVPENRIPALVAKELVDNALDETEACDVELVAGGYAVTDPGDGIPGDDAAVASLFSINRPLTSSKLLRRPTRGALGNGLRVVTGAVVATQGTLLVSTRGRTLRLVHDHDTGDTLAENLGPWDQKGTRIEVSFAGKFSIDANSLSWASKAILLAGRESYRGKTSPLWYDADAFYELLQSAKGKTLRELVACFEGISTRTAGRLVQNAGHNGELCRELSKEQAHSLLKALRWAIVNSVTTKQLGAVGPIGGFENHARIEADITLSRWADLEVEIPVVVEAWTRPTEDEFEITAFVNRTPITGGVEIYKDVDKSVVMSGCGLADSFGGNHKPFEVWFNIDTPYMPITTDGKAPNFDPFSDLIREACQKAAKKIPREKDRPRIKEETQADVIFDLIPGCVRHASGDGKHRFKQRQVFYAVRPLFMERMRFALEYGWFCKVVTKYENRYGEIRGMLRDNRGSVYHPHRGEEIPLGTLNVEDYKRPDWLINKVLYIEKEGFFEILKDEQWPERHDCALMTSKGQGTRAAKDLIDLLGETKEPIEIFLIHDADAAGTMIYQCLQEETATRGARNLKIVNLGLEPAEGRKMGLEVEHVTYRTRQAVADYVPKADREWLQHNRIELNAMTTPQFMKWLDSKFAKHKKLIPPVEVMREQLEEDIRERLHDTITEKILEEAGIDDLVEEAFKERLPAMDDLTEELVDRVTKELKRDRSQPWRKPVGELARTLADDPPPES